METLIIESFDLLSRYRWIHDFQVIDILKKDILRNIPPSWRSCLAQLGVEDLNDVPFLDEGSRAKYPEWPECLHAFLQDSSRLAGCRNDGVSAEAKAVEIEISCEMARGMKSKKLHEVKRLASLVQEVVAEANCNLVIDVGSGLGYLDHVLHQKYGIRVLGMETVQNHASAAEMRAVKQGITCSGIKSLQCHLEEKEESYKGFVSQVESVFPTLNCDCASRLAGGTETSPSTGSTEVQNPRICLIGLHCCGDLSTTMMSYVSMCQRIEAMCCVCCCYHKMAFSDEKFEKFPLSDMGQRIYSQYSSKTGGSFITPFTLRLGAQETRNRWREQTKSEHENHVNHVAFRGLLTLTDEDEGHIRQKVRHCTFGSIHDFLDSYYGLQSDDDPTLTAEKRDRLLSLHDQHKKDFDGIEILTLLQVILQPVIENLIYQDRAQWLREQGLMNVKVLPIFNESISPRNLALVALK